MAEQVLSRDPILTGKQPKNPERAHSLVVCRESGEYATTRLEGTIQQTLGRIPPWEVFSAVRVLELGLAPVEAPEELAGDIQVVRLRYGWAKAVLFCVDNEYYLYSLASATDGDANGEDGFSMILLYCLQLLRPQHLYFAKIWRLLASTPKSVPVRSALTSKVGYLHIGGGAMVESASPLAQLLMPELVPPTAQERDRIVARLLAGKAKAGLRGERTSSKREVPLGYRLEGGKLVPDPTQFDVLVEAQRLLADPNLTPSMIAEWVDRSGVPALPAKPCRGRMRVARPSRRRWVPRRLRRRDGESRPGSGRVGGGRDA